MAELRVDPEFHALIPPLSPDERAGLERKLLDEGFQERYGKILAWNGVIVDGHNRYEICGGKNQDGLVIPVEAEEIEFAGRADAKQWIILNQASRRNLDPISKAELTENLIPLEAEAAKERMAAGGRGGIDAAPESDTEEGHLNLDDLPEQSEDEPGQAVEKAAKRIGVNKNTVYLVRRVKRAGRSDLLDLVRAEKLSLNAAVRIAELYEKLSRPVAEAVEDLAHAGHRRILNDTDELNRLALIDQASPDVALEIVDVIAGDDKPSIRSVFAAEKYLKNKNKPSELPPKNEEAQKWFSAMHDIQMRLNSIRDGGFVGRWSREWSETDRGVLRERLARMARELDRIADELEGGEQTE